MKHFILCFLFSCSVMLQLFCMENSVKKYALYETLRTAQPRNNWLWSDLLKNYQATEIRTSLIDISKTSLTDQTGDTFFLAQLKSACASSSLPDVNFFDDYQRSFDMIAQSHDGSTALMTLINAYVTIKANKVNTSASADSFLTFMQTFTKILQGNIHHKDKKNKTALAYCIEFDLEEVFDKLTASLSMQELYQKEPAILEHALFWKRFSVIEKLVMRDFTIASGFPHTLTQSTDIQHKALLECLNYLKKYQEMYHPDSDTAVTAQQQNPQWKPYADSILTYAALHNHINTIEALKIDNKYEKVIDACIKHNCKGALYHALDHIDISDQENINLSSLVDDFNYLASKLTRNPYSKEYILCWIGCVICCCCPCCWCCWTKDEDVKKWRNDRNKGYKPYKDIKQKAEQVHADIFLQALNDYFTDKQEIIEQPTEDYQTLEDDENQKV